MKVFDTLSDDEKGSLLYGDHEVGIFTSLFRGSENDFVFLNFWGLAFNYYYCHSGNKTVSPLYYKLKENEPEDINESIGSIIRTKFISNWKRIYDAIYADYEVLKDSEYTDTKIGDNTDGTIYNIINTEDYKTQINQTVTNNVTDNDQLYGFNSINGVNTAQSNQVATEKTVAEKTQNGSDTRSSKTGTENKTFIINETVTKSGRKDTGSKLLTDEIEFRNTHIMQDIIFRDIDSIFTINIYI